MRRIHLLLGVVLVTGFGFGLLASRMLADDAAKPDPLKMGTILQRTTLVGCKGMDAVLVQRELPPGGESGKHTQSGNEIVYIQEGAVILEVQGKAPVTVKAGEAFQTTAGEVHNVKNASATEPGKALAFYVAKSGVALDELSVPTH